MGAGIIQFSDETYHGGGTVYAKPVKSVYAAKTYVSPKKAESVLKQLHGSYRNRNTVLLEGAVIWEVDYDFLQGKLYLPEKKEGNSNDNAKS